MKKEISKSEMFSILLEVLPTAKNDWEEYLKEDENENLSYTGISVFARNVVKLSANYETETFSEIFMTVEKLLNDGNEEVKGLIIVGFLEDLQNISSWTVNGNQVFVKWLQPKTLKAWRQLEAIWQGKSSLADVLREELNQEQ